LPWDRFRVQGSGFRVENNGIFFAIWSTRSFNVVYDGLFRPILPIRSNR
jgi:hypothetical protein